MGRLRERDREERWREREERGRESEGGGWEIKREGEGGKEWDEERKK